MSNIFQNIGLTLGLLSAPASVYAESGTFVPAGRGTETAATASRRLRKSAGPAPADQELTTRFLVQRTGKLQEKADEQDRALQIAVDESQKRDAALGERIDAGREYTERNIRRLDKKDGLLYLGLRSVDSFSRRFAMEAGLQYALTDDITNRVSAQAALCYLGNRVTFCAGGGVGKAGERVNTADLSQPETREQDGDYTTSATQTGTETSGQRYQWNASARVAPAHGKRVGKRWEVTPHLSLDAVFNKKRVTTDLSRTTQLYHDNQTVGNPVTASGSETEYSTGNAFQPSVGLDICRDLWNSYSGKALCARVGFGADLENESAVLAVGALVKFQ